MKAKTDKKGLIILTAGGTGGHIYPAESLAQELIRRGYEVEFATDSRAKANYKGILGQIKNYEFSSGAVMGKSVWFKIKSFIKICFGILQACFVLIKRRPICVVGFGGYASFPCCVAAILLGKDLIVHEQNSVMSRTNRTLGRFVKIVAISFKDVKYLPENKKIIYSGMPVRDQIVDLNKKARDFSGEEFKILILGGSQGAKVFADVVPQALRKLAKKCKRKISVVQQSREEDIAAIEAEYKKAGIKAEVKRFYNNMPELYQTSDIIISRAGASSICEILAAGIPSILVPLPTAADNHQYYNALNVVNANAGVLIEQKDFEAEKLCDLLCNLEENSSELEFFSNNAKNAAICDAAKRLADAIEANKEKK